MIAHALAYLSMVDVSPENVKKGGVGGGGKMTHCNTVEQSGSPLAVSWLDTVGAGCCHEPVVGFTVTGSIIQSCIDRLNGQPAPHVAGH